MIIIGQIIIFIIIIITQIIIILDFSVLAREIYFCGPAVAAGSHVLKGIR